MLDKAEPPSPEFKLRDKGKNKRPNQKTKPATSGFSQFWADLTTETKRSEERIERILKFSQKITTPILKILSPLSKLIKPYIFQVYIILFGRKKLFWPLFLLLIMVLLPWISKASLSSQAKAELKAFAQPLDPIKTGQLAMNINQYMPPELYADPDQIVLDEMTKKDSYTLAQQLSVNAGTDAGGPERQAPTYELQDGETIAQVANKFDLHVGTILDANNLKPEELKRIKPGTVLKIPSSDTDTSDEWLVAINRAETEAKAKAEAEAKKKRAAQVASAASNDANDNSISATLVNRGGGYGSVTVIGSSYEQCLPWARAQTGIQIHGYAGNVAATQSEPRVGGIALDRFFGQFDARPGVAFAPFPARLARSRPQACEQP